jgi:hypothetical protein
VQRVRLCRVPLPRAQAVSPPAAAPDAEALRTQHKQDGAFIENIRGNTKRYITLFEEAVDACLPPPSREHVSASRKAQPRACAPC